MRNVVAGAVLALVLLMAVFAVVQYRSHFAPQNAKENVSDPALAAARIKDGFIGDAKIGAWSLSCGPKQELPKVPGRATRAPEKSGRASPGKAPPSEWKIPRCRIYLELKDPYDPDGSIRITVRRAGLNRVLSLFLRFPRREVEVGDSVTLRLDKTDRIVAVLNCSEAFCLAGESIKKGESQSFLAAKRMNLLLKARPSGKNIAVSIPVSGLDQAMAAMVRIDR